MTRHANTTRAKQVRVPVNEDEKAELTRNADAVGLGLAAYLRELGLQHKPPAAIDQAQVEQLLKVNADLGRLGGLLKWWLSEDHLIRGGRVPPGRLQDHLNEIRATQQKMRAVIDQLSK